MFFRLFHLFSHLFGVEKLWNKILLYCEKHFSMKLLNTNQKQQKVLDYWSLCFESILGSAFIHFMLPPSISFILYFLRLSAVETLVKTMFDCSEESEKVVWDTQSVTNRKPKRISEFFITQKACLVDGRWEFLKHKNTLKDDDTKIL